MADWRKPLRAHCPFVPQGVQNCQKSWQFREPARWLGHFGNIQLPVLQALKCMVGNWACTGCGAAVVVGAPDVQHSWDKTCLQSCSWIFCRWGFRKFHNPGSSGFTTKWPCNTRISGAQSCDFNRSLSLERRHTQQWIHSYNALFCNSPSPGCSKPKNVDFEKIFRDLGAILMRTSRLQHFESAFPIGGHGRAIASPHSRGPRGTTWGRWGSQSVWNNGKCDDNDYWYNLDYLTGLGEIDFPAFHLFDLRLQQDWKLPAVRGLHKMDCSVTGFKIVRGFFVRSRHGRVGLRRIGSSWGLTAWDLFEESMDSKASLWKVLALTVADHECRESETAIGTSAYIKPWSSSSKTKPDNAPDILQSSLEVSMSLLTLTLHLLRWRRHLNFAAKSKWQRRRQNKD